MDVKLFLEEFNETLLLNFGEILTALDRKGYWSDGVDNISFVYTENKKGISSVLVYMLAFWDRGIFVEHRFSVPKFLDILEKRKKEHLQLHPSEAEAVEAEFEKFRQKLLRQWAAE